MTCAIAIAIAFLQVPTIMRRQEQERQPIPAWNGRSSADLWPDFSSDPYAGPRNGAWHALVNIPPMEGAHVLPADRWSFRTMLSATATDFSETAEGGTSRYDAVLHKESLQVDYGLLDRLQVGLRLTGGELLEREGDVRVFEDNRQIVPQAGRSLGLAGIVGRAKYAMPLGRGLSGALLAEVKAPVAQEDGLLTAQTWDIGTSLIATWRSGRWTLHASLGAVFPQGEPDLFVENDDLDAIMTYGLSAHFVVTDDWTVGLQWEGNTSAFDVSAIDAPVNALLATARWRLDWTTFLSAAAGIGLDDLSSDWTVSVALDVPY